MKNYFLLLFISTFFSNCLFAQDYEQVAIDSILSIQLPVDNYNYIENDSLDGIKRLVTHGTFEDITYSVYKITSEEFICLENRQQLKEHYQEVNDYLLDGENQQRVKYNSAFIDNGVYQGVLEYNDIDPIDEVLYNNDYRFIQIKETMYQISLFQPARSLDKSIADDFFNSIQINEAYTGKNQYTNCVGDLSLFNQDSEMSSAYNLGYMMGGFICFALVIGLVILVIYLVIRKSKKQSQEQWDRYNE
ncbi:hypothetical protein LX97_01744 [Nonlabens dokdonensis]|uniref:Secreted protein n=2 Tax=Nonlabens dokdonensis TaxID=328515 RepID=L7WB69_NONDD|nr:hypothetical protein [Nonlabens dokdonensis]AGC77447.1 hypothetical protein DDD_2320 [Nonlabens dokdonensis DSW-6]PZX40971.1 hypothetical protein LX97_01744 [Nonlabens dokdonensis]